MTTKKPKRAVVLSGGGARGAYEAGVLRFILDELPGRTGIAPDFDIMSGTSVGAIHACFLAATADETETRGQRLVKIWDRMRVQEIFKFTIRDFFKLPRRFLGVKHVAKMLRDGQRPDRLYGLLDTEPLERLVLQSIPWQGIRRNIRTGRPGRVSRIFACSEFASRRSTPWLRLRSRCSFRLSVWAPATTQTVDYGSIRHSPRQFDWAPIEFS